MRGFANKKFKTRQRQGLTHVALHDGIMNQEILIDKRRDEIKRLEWHLLQLNKRHELCKCNVEKKYLLKAITKVEQDLERIRG